jgi:hypothetical protein
LRYYDVFKLGHADPFLNPATPLITEGKAKIDRIKEIKAQHGF